MERKPSILDNKQTIALIVAGVMITVFVMLVYLPKAGHLKNLRAKLQESRQELADVTLRASRVPTVAAEVERLVPIHKQNMLRLPDDGRVPEFLHEVSAVLAQEETTRRELMPGAPRTETGYVELPITITFDSTFGGAFRTLARIERLERMSRVDSIRITAAPDQSGAVRVELRLVIFQIGVPQGAGSAKGKASA